ncbi:hypothetical protein [Rhizobium sp. WYCCWR 11146]|uniref:hypothetical protein n=1 Tax=Rhizobium sp. WYCCWR 11146 TaxID=2749833 RepID=UPI0015E75A64|nr:hypothetical protein [Rhizobium sp. WYCCWR 11146]MBA1343890.1 hypothetical protein [Rhizobium sp. WYCCWR 11146]
METQIKNIDLAALAATAFAKLTGIHKDLAELADISAAVFESINDEYRNHESGKGRPYCVISGDYWLARAIARGVKDVRDEIVNPNFSASGAVYEIADRTVKREEEYKRAEEETIREARIAAIHAAAAARNENAEIAETADRIVSDFLKISSHTEACGKGKRKEFFATLVFLFDGNVYEVESKFDKDTHEFTGRDFTNGRQGYEVKDRRVMENSFLFKAEMTVEEIGKAAHALDCIRAALREQAGPIVVAAIEDASEEPAALEEAA